MKNPWISNAILICRSANFSYLISVVDVDECTVTPPKCAGAGQRCTNFPGAYRCHCVSPRQQLNDDESACIGMYGARLLSYSFHIPDFFMCPLNELSCNLRIIIRM